MAIATLHDGGLQPLFEERPTHDSPTISLCGESIDLPGPLLALAIKKAARYSGAPNELEAIRRVASDMKSDHSDGRFGIVRQSYLRSEITHRLDILLKHGRDRFLEAADSFVLISFDLNGLKAMNDLAGHQAGDELLQRVVIALTTGHTTQTLKKFSGVDAFVASGGGDEFFVLLQGARDPEKLLRGWQDEVRAIDCSDILDFMSPEITKQFVSTQIPEGFVFRPTIAGGYSTLAQALRMFSYDAEADFHVNLQRIMGLMFDLTHEPLMADKRRIKAELALGTPQEQFLAAVYRRTEEAVQLEIENQLLRTNIAQLQAALETCRGGLDN